jgi:acetylglutamate kinase
MKALKIVKIGGNIIDKVEALDGFLKEFSMLTTPKILVHGGGKSATKLADQLGIPVALIEGRRVTDATTLDVISMVYAGKINKTIIAKLQAQHCNAMGFSGADGNTIVSEKRNAIPLDFGFAGDVIEVNTEVLQQLLTMNITPVFCALTHDNKGQLLNTNADTIAAELAVAFAKDWKTELLYCFEKWGVMEDISVEDSLITHITAESYAALIQQKVIADGMLPKLENCFYALRNGVAKVYIGKAEELFHSTQKYTSITL